MDEEEEDNQLPYGRVRDLAAFEACVVAEVPAVLNCENEAWWPSDVTFNFLEENYGHKKVQIDGDATNLGAFLQNIDDEKRYLRNVHCSDLGLSLEFPTPLGPNALANQPDVPPKWRSWFELFVLPRQCFGYPFLHRDCCDTHAYSIQLTGTKRFVIFPPDQTPYLYSSGRRSQITNPNKVDLTKFPLFAKARHKKIDLLPGDLMFLPRNWWHTTHGIGTDHGLTIGGNYANDATLLDFIDEFAHYTAMKSLGQHHQAAFIAE